MTKEAKRGDIRLPSTHDLVEDDLDLGASLTTICIVGTNLRQNVNLVKDAKSFGHKLVFSR